MTGIDGDASVETILEGSPEEKESLYANDVCLERGEYEFVIQDSYGDGLSSPGYYEIKAGGVLIAEGADFGGSETVLFQIPTA